MGKSTGRFDSPCGPILVSYRADAAHRSGGYLCAELLDTAGPGKFDYPEIILADDWPELRHLLEQRREMADLAERGKWLADREDDELEAMRLMPTVGTLLADVIPERAAARARAAAILASLRNAGYHIGIKHCAARCEPDPPAELAAAFARFRPQIEDLLLLEEEIECRNPRPPAASGNSQSRSGRPPA